MASFADDLRIFEGSWKCRTLHFVLFEYTAVLTIEGMLCIHYFKAWCHGWSRAWAWDLALMHSSWFSIWYHGAIAAMLFAFGCWHHYWFLVTVLNLCIIFVLNAHCFDSPLWCFLIISLKSYGEDPNLLPPLLHHTIDARQLRTACFLCLISVAMHDSFIYVILWTHGIACLTYDSSLLIYDTRLGLWHHLIELLSLDGPQAHSFHTLLKHAFQKLRCWLIVYFPLMHISLITMAFYVFEALPITLHLNEPHCWCQSYELWAPKCITMRVVCLIILLYLRGTYLFEHLKAHLYSGFVHYWPQILHAPIPIHDWYIAFLCPFTTILLGSSCAPTCLRPMRHICSSLSQLCLFYSGSINHVFSWNPCTCYLMLTADAPYCYDGWDMLTSTWVIVYTSILYEALWTGLKHAMICFICCKLIIMPYYLFMEYRCHCECYGHTTNISYITDISILWEID